MRAITASLVTLGTLAAAQPISLDPATSVTIENRSFALALGVIQRDLGVHIDLRGDAASQEIAHFSIRDATLADLLVELERQLDWVAYRDDSMHPSFIELYTFEQFCRLCDSSGIIHGREGLANVGARPNAPRTGRPGELTAADVGLPLTATPGQVQAAIDGRHARLEALRRQQSNPLSGLGLATVQTPGVASAEEPAPPVTLPPLPRAAADHPSREAVRELRDLILLTVQPLPGLPFD